MRVKIQFPVASPLLTTTLPVRITDLNYGGHLGNDTVMRIAHEARAEWLRTHRWTELETGSHGLIMADAAIAFRGESFYGDVLTVDLYADEIGPKSFDFLSRIVARRGDTTLEVAHVKAGMVCFDYRERKICAMSDELAVALNAQQ